MQSRTRLVCVAVTAAVWAAWLIVSWAARANESPPVGILFARDVAQMCAGVGAFVLIIGFVASPVLSVADTWREIGAREQQRHCDSCPRAADRRRLGNIIPIRFDGRLDRADRN